MTEAGPPASPVWRRLLARRRTRIVLAVLLLAIAVRAVLPAILRRVVVAQADKAMIGRVEIDDVDLALLTGGFTLHGLRVFSAEAPAPSDASAIAPSAAPGPGPSTEPATPPAAGEGPPGSAPVLSAKRLMVDLGFLALLRRTVEIQRIELDDVAVSLDRSEDGTLLLPAAAPAPEPTPTPTTEGAGWGVLIQSVALHEGRIGFRDFAVSNPPQRVEVALPELDAAQLALLVTQRGLQPGKVSLEAGIQDGTLHLDAKLEHLESGPAYESHLVLTNVPIADSRLYIPKVGWSGLTGRLDADVVHRFESQGAHTVRGTAALRDLDVRVAELDEPALAWRKLAVEAADIDLVAQHADVKAVSLDGPRVVTKPAGPDRLPVVEGLLTMTGRELQTASQKARSAAAAAGAVAERAIGASPGALATPTAIPSPVATATPAVAEPGVEPSPSAAEAMAPPAATVTSTKPWTWAVGTLRLTDGNVHAIGGDGPLDVAVDAEAAPLSSATEKPVTVKVTLAPSSGGSVAVTGDVVQAPLAFDGTLTAKDLRLAPLGQPVATAATRLLKNGVANLDLAIAVGATPKAPPDGVRVSGTIGLSDVDVAGEDPTTFAIRWKDFAVTLGALTAPGVLHATSPGAGAGPFDAAFTSIALTRPEITVTRTATGIVLPASAGTTPAQPPRAPAPAAAAPAAVASAPQQRTPEVRVQADRVTIAQLRLATTDTTVQPFYRSTLDPVDLTASAVGWPGPAAKDVKLVAKTDDGAVLTITGAVAPARTQLLAKLTGLPLASFNPYAASTGYAVAGGTAQLQSAITIQRGAYDTKSHVVLNGLDVRSGGGDALFTSKFGMPLELALSLMTDLQGNIVLDVPISGDEKGMRTGLGTLVGNALTRAILNAVTSPLKLIGAVARIGEKPAALAPQPIVFQTGRPVLADGETAKLASLAKLLAQAPGLRLHVRGEAGDADRRWLREQALRATLEKESGVLGSVRHIGERGARKAVLAALVARADGKAADVPAEYREWFEAAVAAETVDDAALRTLAAARATEVATKLTSGQGVEAARIVVDDPRAGDTAGSVVTVGLGAPAPIAAAQPPASATPVVRTAPSAPAATPAARRRR